MTVKRNYWLSAIALLGGFLFLLPGMSLAAEVSLEERVRTLEKAQAETEQVKKATLPTFIHRPRGGMRIEAPDRSWGLRFGGRLHYRTTFWDDQAKESAGFSQGDVALRRFRPRMDLYWGRGFYELDFELNIAPDLTVELQTAVFKVHFERQNPFLPTLSIGPKVSTFFNAHDTNWGSSTGGLFDRSMFQDGAGIGAGSQSNAIGLDWKGLPVGAGDMDFQFVFSNNGLTSAAKQARPKTDKKAVHLGWKYQPFSQLRNKWLSGMDMGLAYQLDRVLPGENGRSFFQVRTTERQRLALIEIARDLEPESTRHYITPGFGWKVGPNWLRTSAAWNRGTFVTGDNVLGRYWRVADELYVWSPKGAFTGSASTAKSIMLFAGYERDDYEADNKGLRGGFDNAYATNLNAGLWYIFRPGIRLGFEYGRYFVDKIDRGADSLEGVKKGDPVTFDTLELGLTVDF